MRLLLVGGGNMGAALLAGWNNSLSGLLISVIDPHPSEQLKTLCAQEQLFQTAQDVTGTFDMIVLAIKPQSFPDVLPMIKDRLDSNGVVMSIAAGKTMQSISDVFGTDKAVIRVMPNTPSLIGEGMSVLVANEQANNNQKNLAERLLQAVGKTLWLQDEDNMHAVTALSGSGPAYLFAMIEAMQKAGESLGLSQNTSLTLAKQTVLGAAKLAVKQETATPAELRQQVTSPGGTTAAALDVLLGDDALDKLMKTALSAATQRSRELS